MLHSPFKKKTLDVSKPKTIIEGCASYLCLVKLFVTDNHLCQAIHRTTSVREQLA